jgi:hypothetical protein
MLTSVRLSAHSPADSTFTLLNRKPSYIYTNQSTRHKWNSVWTFVMAEIFQKSIIGDRYMKQRTDCIKN